MTTASLRRVFAGKHGGDVVNSARYTSSKSASYSLRVNQSSGGL